MKRISPGTVTIGVMAILFGLGVAYAARHYLNQSPILGPAPRPETATIVVPRVNLPQYARIRQEDLNVVQVPIKKVPEGAVRMSSRALYRLVKSTIMAGQPILEENLYGVGEVPRLAEQLPPGYRAVTLQVNANSALNGMIQPQSYVDISLTVEGSNPQLEGMATLTLLRRVLVLATSQNRFPRTEDNASDLRNITVAATSEQANKLILAQRYGTLSVTLRSSVDDDALAATGDDRDLVNPYLLLGLTPIEPVPEPEAITRSVQIWRGGKMQEVKFGVGQIQEAVKATAIADGQGEAQGEAMAESTSADGTSARPTPAKPPCKACEAKKRRQEMLKRLTESGGKNQPTLAPPRDQATPTLAPPAGKQSSGQVIEVQIEANQAKGEGDK